MKILLAIPCYNCANQISRVKVSLKNSNLSGVDEIIFINNKSGDSTKEEILKPTTFSKPTFLIENKQNYGLGGSFKLVYEYACKNEFSHILFFHGDDQADVNDIETLAKKAQGKSKFAAIYGARFSKESKLSGYSKVRILGNTLFNLLFSLLTLKKIEDIGSGINLYSVSHLQDLSVEYWPNHVAFDVNILLGLIKKGEEFQFQPIHWKERDQISNAGNVSTGLIVLRMLLRWFFGLPNTNEKWKIEFQYDKIQL